MNIKTAELLGVKNGALLRAAAAQFDALITVDQKMRFSAESSRAGFGGSSSDREALSIPSAQVTSPRVLEVLEQIKAGEVVEIE